MEFFAVSKCVCYEEQKYHDLLNFWHSQDRESWYILILEAKKINSFSTLFWSKTLHVSGRFTVHHQESWYCIQSNWYLSYKLCCRLLVTPGWRSLYILLYHIAALLLYGSSLVLLYLYVCSACLTLRNLTFRGLYFVLYSYNKCQRDALFLYFI